MLAKKRIDTYKKPITFRYGLGTVITTVFFTYLFGKEAVTAASAIALFVLFNLLTAIFFAKPVGVLAAHGASYSRNTSSIRTHL